jgi:hypothetical protein
MDTQPRTDVITPLETRSYSFITYGIGFAAIKIIWATLFSPK